MRTAKLCKVFLSLVLLSGCAHTWDKTLTTLNQPPMSAQALLDEDLYQLNQTELNAIKTWWQPLEDELKASGLDRKSIRLQRLKFLHEKTRKLNQKTLAALEQPGEPGKLSREQAALILDEARRHEVASPEKAYSFARADEVGFCFGRALLIHASLLKAGVPQGQISKIFNLGELKVKNTFWHFHVAVLVNSSSGYLIMDPLHPAPLSVPDWIRINENYDVKAPWSQVRFYITDPRKFTPGAGQYAEGPMKNSAYQDYFSRLIPTLFDE